MWLQTFKVLGKIGLLVLAMLAVEAPLAAGHGDLVAAVTVDGRNNCLETEYRRIAQRIHLEPGRYILSLDRSEGIAYGRQEIYRRRRPVNVLLDFDPACVSLLNTFHGDPAERERVAPLAAAALFAPDGHAVLSRMAIEVTAPTEVYAYLLDRRADDNAGGVTLGVHRDQPHGSFPPKGNPVARVWIDARRNCLATDLRRVARSIALEPGKYHVRLGQGAIVYGSGAAYRQRPTANVLLDFDPADVGVYDTCGPGEEGEAPVAALGLNPFVSAVSLYVRRRTTLYAYVLDYHAGGNSGAVRVEVRKGALGH
jgi:hypothetical protein